VRRRLGHSIKLRMVVVFLLLAVALTFVFISGAQKAFSLGWREAARPLLMDYVDHLAADVLDPDGRPSVARAQALARRLPVTVRISGPEVHWASHPGQAHPEWSSGREWPRMLQRTTADGHTVTFGLNEQVFEHRPRLVGYTLSALLLLTLLAWLYVRRLLKPLDAIGAGAQRFGAGDFSRPIEVSHPHRPDELGQLAQTINTMGRDIHQMLEAKRALLLAISHELRSPLTRARLNAELLPEDAATLAQREALLRDLQEMGRLITDLLEGERLAGGGHAALQREPTDLVALVRALAADVDAPGVVLHLPEAPADLELLRQATLDPTRTRLLLRNLLANTQRHAAQAPAPAELHLAVQHPPDGPWLVLSVRDHGPGVPPEHLDQLAQAFVRPDSARTRTAGGVGLGLYLCRLVALAHGGTLTLANARPGLQVVVRWPLAPLAGAATGARP
jgi:signal transduction histidine kinase